MIRFETYQKIQAHKALGIGQRRTADDLKISLYQVTHWWHKTEDEFHAFEQEHEFMLDNYRSWLLEQIKPFPQIDNTLLFQRLRETFPGGGDPEILILPLHKEGARTGRSKKPKREYIFRAAPEPGNQRTKESPRRRFQDEYLSLQKVYASKRSTTQVITPNNGAVQYDFIGQQCFCRRPEVWCSSPIGRYRNGIKCR